MTDIDQIIEQCVEDIWHKYDKDGSGELDKEEARAFAEKILGPAAASFSDDDFENIFLEFDGDGSGKIDKKEMASFIKRVTGLQY